MMYCLRIGAKLGLLLLSLLSGCGSTAKAADIEHADVEYRDGTYIVDFAVVLRGAVDRILAMAGDYENLHTLSGSVVSSRIVSGRPGSDARIELVMRPCVFVVFCKTITKVSDARVHEDRREVVYVAVPGLSDFSVAREEIALEPVVVGDGDGARFRYRAELTPKFYVPPFIGPWVIQNQIVKDLKQTSREIERIASETDQREH